MQPLFVPEGSPLPARALVVDAGMSGAASTLSHWQGSTAPPVELEADTSTEIVLNAALDPARWLADYDYVCNNHVDADGLISVAIACHPEWSDYRALLVGAAEAGDFSAWPGEAPFRVMLCLHQLIRSERLRGSGWEQRSYERVCVELPVLIDDAAKPDAERDAQVKLITNVRTCLLRSDGFIIDHHPGLSVVRWRERLGHASDDYITVHQPDDLPPWALSGLIPETSFQLLCAETVCAETDTGTRYQLDAPRHSWARTVRRASVIWPEFTAVAQLLQSREQSSCRWLARPSAAKLGFVCVFASSNADGSVTAPSTLPWEDVAGGCASVIRSAP